MKKMMPAIFVGHGSPMNALLDNVFTGSWGELGARLPTPRAILCVSAHWYLPGTWVTAMPRPRTIHDFGGFPKRLSEVQYPAPGAPDLAAHIRDLMAPVSAGLDMGWGLDHGAWSVLCRMFPQANIPVVQLSLDRGRSPDFHYEAGKKLASLREEGVLVIGSGNVVHNLDVYAWGERCVEPQDWALRFETRVRALIAEGGDAQLVAYEKLGQDALRSVPTPEHYLPLLYILALRRAGERAAFPVEGFDGGSISMLAVQVG